MKLRTIIILVLMMSIVLLTSAFGAYQDSLNKIDDKPHHAKDKHSKEVVGASGAGTSYKQSKSHLDVSEKANGPYVKEGPNSYRGKAGGYELRNRDSDSERDDDSDSDSDSEPKTEFQKKMKYISKTFEEIFSKWKSQEPIMAPSGIEENLDNPDTMEGFKIREKFKKTTRQGMRILKNAFGVRRRS